MEQEALTLFVMIIPLKAGGMGGCVGGAGPWTLISF